MKLKINKTLQLLIFSSLSFFSLGSYVSFVDADSAGGIIIEKETMPEGSVVFRIDDKNPADIYGGTWELLPENAQIAFGDGSIYSGTVIDDNNQLVPLEEHTHTGSFSGNALPGHKHNLTMHTSNGTNGSGEEVYSRYADYGSGTITLTSVSGGTPSGQISLATSGVSSVTLDVRGERIRINAWKRIL